MWQKLGEGGNTDLGNAESFEESMDEGQRGRLVLNFAVSVPDWQIDSLKDSLNFAGVEDLEIVSSGTQLSITWRKGIAWVPIIILAVIALAALIVAWQMYKEVAAAPLIVQLGTVGAVILVVIIVGGILLLPYFLSKKTQGA